MIIYEKLENGMICQCEDPNLIFRDAYKGVCDVENIYFDYFSHSKDERMYLVDLFFDIYTMTSGDKIIPISEFACPVNHRDYREGLEAYLKANNTSMVTIEILISIYYKLLN